MQILNPSGKKDIDTDKVKAFFGVSLCLRALVAKKTFRNRFTKLNPNMFVLNKKGGLLCQMLLILKMYH